MRQHRCFLQLRAGAFRASLLAGIVALVSCQPPLPPAPAPPRVLIVGIDGAAPRVLDTMFAMGRLRNLQSIAERGTYGGLKSEEHLLSPRVWTTIATGKTPEKHGIEGWVKVGNDAKADLFYGSDRRGAALWNILSNAGKQVAVVNWLVTYPPEIVNGTIITDHSLAYGLEGKRFIGDIFAKAQGAELQPLKTGTSPIFPPEWAPRALAPKHEEPRLSHLPSPFREGAPDDAFLAHRAELEDFRKVDERLTSMTLEILDEKKPDVTMVLLQGIDRVSHFLYGCLESTIWYPEWFEPTFAQRLQCQRAMYDYYDFTDELIGKLLTRFRDTDLVMVISDHGFEAGFGDGRTGNHTSAFASFGVCLASGPRIIPNGKVNGTRVVDIAPTVLDWYGLPVAEDMDGKPATFLERVEPSPVPVKTYDDVPIERLGSGESGGEAAVKEKLKSLGYLQ